MPTSPRSRSAPAARTFRRRSVLAPAGGCRGAGRRPVGLAWRPASYWNPPPRVAFPTARCENGQSGVARSSGYKPRTKYDKRVGTVLLRAAQSRSPTTFVNTRAPNSETAQRKKEGCSYRSLTREGAPPACPLPAVSNLAASPSRGGWPPAGVGLVLRPRGAPNPLWQFRARGIRTAGITIRCRD